MTTAPFVLMNLKQSLLSGADEILFSKTFPFLTYHIRRLVLGYHAQLWCSQDIEKQ